MNINEVLPLLGLNIKEKPVQYFLKKYSFKNIENLMKSMDDRYNVYIKSSALRCGATLKNGYDFYDEDEKSENFYLKAIFFDDKYRN